METGVDPLLDELLAHYGAAAFPALLAQYRDWSRSRPLVGLRVLDAAPLFRNTLAKHAALRAAGADLTLVVSDAVPHDPAAAARATAAGLRVLDAVACRREAFDIVLDCAGGLADLAPRLGFVELTRSGVARYAGSAKPVFVADAGRLKLIETALGTGDGLVRALRHLGHDDLRGWRCVVFGCGKVGRGIIRSLRAAGAEPVAVDDPAALPVGLPGIDRHDAAAVTAALARAACVITATGVRHALHGRYPAAAVLGSGALLVNMGVEDEFGPEIPEDRILNRNRPLNFILDEPTRMPYIDPVLALHNAGAVWLLDASQPGCAEPPPALEAAILDTVRADGLIGRELDDLETWFR